METFQNGGTTMVPPKGGGSVAGRVLRCIA
jgi:hypothetical protein